MSIAAGVLAPLLAIGLGAFLIALSANYLAQSMGGAGPVGPEGIEVVVDRLRRGWTEGAEVLVGLALLLTGLVVTVAVLVNRPGASPRCLNLTATRSDVLALGVELASMEAMLAHRAASEAGVVRARVRIGGRGRMAVRAVVDRPADPALVEVLTVSLERLCGEMGLPCGVARVEIIERGRERGRVR